MTELRKFSLKKCSTVIVIITMCMALTWNNEARCAPLFQIGSTLTKLQDTTKPLQKDSLTAKIDTIKKNDSLPSTQKIDTFSLKLSKDSLDGPVNYEAEDSAVVLVQQKKILLYGKTKTTYKDIILKAPLVKLDQQTNMVTALADRDSLGQVLTKAHFEQPDNNFETDSMSFNFKTQKGLTYNTITQQQEMFVHGEKIKKVNATTFFVSRGQFTTCNLDEPHFAFRTNKLKVINNKLAVSGPTHPEFEGVPLPIYLPFGFFPLSRGRHSGFLPPQFTTNEQFGVGLEGIGYYKVLNDNIDVTLRGNLYSYGGWNANLTSTYRTRYRYNGGVNFSLQHTKFNFKGDPDYNLSKTFFITWNHSVDQKARPGTNFSASVNAGSSKFNQYIPNNPYRNFQNQLGSSIAYSKTWAGKPYNLTLSANHNQNNNTHLINVVLPDGSFTVQTLYPFQKKEAVGAAKWYEKLGIGYNGTFRNQLSFYDTTQLKFERLLDTMQWGAQHRVPITLSLPPMGPFIVSPSVSYEEVWLQNKFIRQWDNTNKKLDTVIQQKGFYTDRQVSFGVGFNTSIYGTFNFKNSRLVALRHVIRPTFSFNYKPDLSKEHYYKTQIDTFGNELSFSEFEGSLFQPYGQGKFGGISFGVDNNLEMKVRSKKDTGENAIKKLPLIDGFGFSSGYNFLRDTSKLENFNLYLRSTLFEKINLNMSAMLVPYQIDKFGRPTRFYAWQGKRFSIGQINYGSISLSTSFKSKKKDETKEDQPDPNQIPLETDPNLLGQQQQLMDYMRRNPAEFVDFNVPWSINLSFSLSYNKRPKPDYSGFESDVTSNISFNNSFSLTPKWNFSTNGYLDIKTRKLETFTMSISRDMHCWQMSINVTPVGIYRYFSFNLNPKAGILQDLKVNRTRSFYSY
jgi:lipopolysaccharide assembly outer membrane protein LptD (OstA)